MMPTGNPLAPTSGPMGSMSPPTPNPGLMADSFSKIGTAVQMLQNALPGLPVGDEAQKAVLDAITKLSKIAPASAQVPGVQTTQLRGLEKQAQEGAMLQALLRAMQSGGGGGGAPTPGGAPGGAMPMPAPRPSLPPPVGAGAPPLM